MDELDLPDRPPPRGAFERLLSTEQFVRPGLLSVARERGNSVSRSVGLRLPADFESQERLVFVADKLATGFAKELVEIVEATRGRAELIGLVSSSQGRDSVLRVLAENGLAANSIRLTQLPSDTMWLRDFGPVFVRSADRGVFALDFDYARRSGDRRRRQVSRIRRSRERSQA